MSVPSYWQPVVQSAFYGKYIRSALYTKSGKGDKTLTWKTPIDKPGYYDIFCFIGKTADRMMIRAGGFGGGARPGGAPGPPGAGDREEMPTELLPHPIKNFTTGFIMTAEARRLLLIMQMPKTDGTNWAPITSLPTLQKLFFQIYQPVGLLLEMQ